MEQSVTCEPTMFRTNKIVGLYQHNKSVLLNQNHERGFVLLSINTHACTIPVYFTSNHLVIIYLQ